LIRDVLEAMSEIDPNIDRVDHLVNVYSEDVLAKTDFLAKKYESREGKESGWNMFVNPLLGDNLQKTIFGGNGFLPESSFADPNSFIPVSSQYNSYNDVRKCIKFLSAGPRQNIFYDPRKVKAVIITCGGLCPGLNVVIRELVMTLHYSYEVKEVYGIKWGYKGIYTDIEKNWIKLTPQNVARIHKEGGTILGSSRGNVGPDVYLDALVAQGVNQVYCIGGDGTHRGIYALAKRAVERGIVISFAGVPKTIDNDIPLIDYSFGFNSSVEVAVKMVQASYA
jgi:6-phosphofructokinase 1